MSQADDCPCPHWGYALKGRLHVDRNDQEDTKFLEVALRNTGVF